jgi:hypothetical protein
MHPVFDRRCGTANERQLGNTLTVKSSAVECCMLGRENVPAMVSRTDCVAFTKGRAKSPEFVSETFAFPIARKRVSPFVASPLIRAID